jgi:hypothetical protein
VDELIVVAAGSARRLCHARLFFGMAAARHAEHDLWASSLIIMPLSRSLLAQRLDSPVAKARSSVKATGEYAYNFGLNPEPEARWHEGG